MMQLSLLSLLSIIPFSSIPLVWPRPRCCEAAMASSLPPTSSVHLVLGPAGAPLELDIMHVSHPRAEAARKKQCDLWAFVWASGVVASELLWRVAPSGVLRGLSVMELGAGSGLPSLVACHVCGAAVTATDLVPDALALVRENSGAVGAALGSDGEVLTQRLDWNAPGREGGPTGPFDLIIGADVLYLSSCVRPVLVTAATLLRPGGVLLLVDPGRPTTEAMEDEAAAAGFVLAASPVFTAVGTCVAVMPKCAVFVLEKGVREDGEAPSALLSALLSSLSRVGEMEAAPVPSPVGYTLSSA